MNLAELRRAFVERSGRYDLVSETGTDMGANFFIQSGQRFLDRRADIRAAQEAVAVADAPAGRSFIEVPNCWLIQKVSFLEDLGSDWHELQRLSTRGPRRYMLANWGQPRYYTVSTRRHTPSHDKLTADMVNIPADAFTLGDWGLLSIFLELLPRPAMNGTLEVKGRFYSTPLVDDPDTSYWSEAHPEVLLKAALYQLETFYRNTEGANDWLASIQMDLVDIEQLEIFQDIEGRDEMGL